MKKIVIIMMALVGALTVQAEEYAYLTFETTDGAKASVDVSSLTLTISGKTMTATRQLESRRSPAKRSVRLRTSTTCMAIRSRRTR